MISTSHCQDPYTVFKSHWQTIVVILMMVVPTCVFLGKLMFIHGFNFGNISFVFDEMLRNHWYLALAGLICVPFWWGYTNPMQETGLVKQALPWACVFLVIFALIAGFTYPHSSDLFFKAGIFAFYSLPLMCVPMVILCAVVWISQMTGQYIRIGLNQVHSQEG